ncbi:MAG: hypothetical protein FGM43_08460 [Sinobacteraceae bacterium]|nr:hypothetical protein [Nevskiaceae bacterium]
MIRLGDDDQLRARLAERLDAYGLQLQSVPTQGAIPGTYWGESEAGLQGVTLFVRDDTPLHSALHEAAHFVCMSAARRSGLDRDAGGDDAEENAVCYLQILWCDGLGVPREQLMADMDAWGYSFRLGSAARWFADDADEAREWLQQHAIIDAAERPTGRRRET